MICFLKQWQWVEERQKSTQSSSSNTESHHKKDIKLRDFKYLADIIIQHCTYSEQKNESSQECKDRNRDSKAIAENLEGV